MTRYKILLEYEGSNFSGWQRQASVVSIQEVTEEAIRRCTGLEVVLYCAGRTDAGVHALGQVAHFDCDAINIPIDRFAEAINYHLRPWPVVVLAVEEVPADWHARFSALSKTYIYRVINRRARLTLDRGRALHVTAKLDLNAMRSAGKALLGKHDFSSFRSSDCQANSPIRSLDKCDIESTGEEIRFTFQAKSFLHNQVRIMVGCLLAVGLVRSDCDVGRILAAKDRRVAKDTAPAHGLYLSKVHY